MAAAVAIMWPTSKAAPSLDYAMPIEAGIGLIAAGLAIGVAAFLQFRKAQTTINPMTPHETSALVTDGLYALSRNPIYVADVIILLGCALLFGNAAAFLVVPLFALYIDRFQIVPEERALRSRFGSRYEDYLRKVRRWL